MNRHKLLNWIFRGIFALVNRFITYADIYHNNERFKATVIGKDHTKHGYTGKYDDLVTAMTYAEEIATPDFGEATPTESYRLHQEQVKTLRDLILSEKPKNIFNFGVCYAYVDRLFSDINFMRLQTHGCQIILNRSFGSGFSGIELCWQKDRSLTSAKLKAGKRQIIHSYFG